MANTKSKPKVEESKEMDQSHVKGSIAVGSVEVMVWLPAKWQEKLEQKFINVLSHTNEPIAFNLGYVSSIMEVNDIQWKNWLTRLEVASKNAQNQLSDMMQNNDKATTTQN